MSQIRLTDRERIQALTHLGYGEREAAFLGLAALQGGYFLRRQYAAFLGKALGGTAAALIEKLLAKGHARGTTYAANTHIYHLCARPLYAAIGQEDNRNRRLRQPTAIKNKLMNLDFVLAHRENRFLATELDKLDYFTGTRQVERRLLPTKRYASRTAATERFFIEKFPIFLSAPLERGEPPAVSFCFVDTGSVGLDGFATFLQAYAPLWQALGAFHVVYVADRVTHFQRAGQLFNRRLGVQASPRSVDPEESWIDRLTAHFEMRQRYEAQQWDAFDRVKLVRFRDERLEFSGAEAEGWYGQWKAGGRNALNAVLGRNSVAPEKGLGTFSTFYLQENYDLFGHLGV